MLCLSHCMCLIYQEGTRGRTIHFQGRTQVAKMEKSFCRALLFLSACIALSVGFPRAKRQGLWELNGLWDLNGDGEVTESESTLGEFNVGLSGPERLQ